MAKTKISEWSATPANNTDIDNINIAEGCAPSGINDAIREMMAQIKDLYAGTSGDIIAVAAGGTGVGTSTGSGSNVLSTSPTLVTPALGTPSALVGTNITGTATSFNINGTVGATTPTTGAFTTIAASGNVTLSGGTANGVAYLNGSKVVTSGSALTYSGSTLSIKAGNGDQLVLNNAGERFTQLTLQNNGTTKANLNVDNTNSLYEMYGASGFSLVFSPNASEAMRLTSTGLGIGTSSPNISGVTEALTVNGSDAIIEVANGGTLRASLYGNSSGAALSGVGSVGLRFYTSSSGATTLAATIDTAQNMGLGVTPSAWQVNNRAIQLFEGYASISSNNSQGCADVGMNCYNTSAGATAGWKYTNSFSASLYQQHAGLHKWLIAPSGTAGDAITFTQAMTLDASGNLIVGATSAGNAKVTSVAGIGFEARDGTQPFYQWFNSAGATDKKYWRVGVNTSGELQWQTVNDAYNAATNRMVLDSSGNLLVGTTSVIGTERLNVTKSANSYIVYFNNTNNTSGDQVIRSALGTNANNTSSYHLVGTAGGSDRIYIYGNGNIVNANNSYGGISDSKLKENIVDATPKLAGLMQVKVRNYNLIGDTAKQLGVVAQELETVFPSMVDETPDRDAEGNDLGTTTKSVKYSVFVPMLIKAIQELKAEFDAYKASHP